MTPLPAPLALLIRVVDVYPYRVGEDGRAEWLLLRRAAGHLYDGVWRMVGGKVDAGETAHATARRELREETGQAARRLWTVPSVNVFYEWTDNRLTLAPAFAAELDPNAALRLDAEHDDALWLPADAAAERLAWPEQARLLRLADACLTRGLDPAWVVSG